MIVKGSSLLMHAVLASVVSISGPSKCSLSAAEQPTSPGPQPRQADGRTIKLPIPQRGQLTVQAYWEPIKDSMSNFHLHWEELAKLRPAKSSKLYDGTDFKAFLPRYPVAVGDIWKLEEAGLLTFLRQFHAGATLKLHINNGDSPGAYACLRAFNDRYAEIVFRIHAEFVLKEGFFTPGQFTGSVLLDRANREVVFFRIYVPPGRINFDVNRRVTVEFNGKIEERHVTDAGFVPRMELVGGKAEVTRDIRWTDAKSLDDVRRALALKFYRFKNIQWIEFEKALALAKKDGKPLHVVAVDGTLDDESC